jgi:protein O-mannosyl-transferase
MKNRLDVALALAAGAASIVPLAPILGAELLNWDDDAVFTGNGNLVGAGLLRWAFTTTYMGHYQPLSWLTWGVLARFTGLQPAAFHALSLATHALVVALVYLTAVRLMDLRAVPRNRARIGAVASAMLFGVHPLRVEPVAWASAFPYLAAMACALMATLAYLTSRARTAIALFAASLLFRPIAFGLPLVFLALDRFAPQDGRPARARARTAALPPNKMPYFALAIAAAGLEWMARRGSFDAVAAGPRATMALTAPFIYLWRTVAPFGLSPVDVLALDAATSRLAIAAALLGLIATSLLAWRAASRWPAVLLAWTTYLLLLAPAVAPGPTGLQSIADRYAYLPSVAIAVAIGSACAAAVSESRRRAMLAAASLAVLACAVITWRQTPYWHDSIALWSRAAALDPRNDVAHYNLGTALQSAGRADEAAAAYEATLRLVPDHSPAQHNLRGLQAIARQRQADALAQSGNLAAAIPLYREALALDPARARARAALGVALVQSEDFAGGAAEIETAAQQGIDNPNLVNVRSYALVQLGRTDEAAAVLRAAIARYPGDANLAHNLALLTEKRN